MIRLVHVKKFIGIEKHPAEGSEAVLFDKGRAWLDFLLPRIASVSQSEPESDLRVGVISRLALQSPGEAIRHAQNKRGIHQSKCTERRRGNASGWRSA